MLIFYRIAIANKYYDQMSLVIAKVFILTRKRKEFASPARTERDMFFINKGA